MGEGALVLTRREAVFFVVVALAAPATVFADSDPRIKVRLLATSDLHCYLEAYDYYHDAPEDTVGLVRIAALVKAASKLFVDASFSKNIFFRSSIFSICNRLRFHAFEFGQEPLLPTEVLGEFVVLLFVPVKPLILCRHLPLEEGYLVPQCFLFHVVS